MKQRLGVLQVGGVRAAETFRVPLQAIGMPVRGPLEVLALGASAHTRIVRELPRWRVYFRVHRYSGFIMFLRFLEVRHRGRQQSKKLFGRT